MSCAKISERQWATLVFMLLFSTFLLTHDITEKWVGNRDSCGAFYGVIAKHYIQYGYVGTRLGMVMDSHPDGTYDYYLSHPPLFPILISLAYRVFGVHEWSTRLIPILFSLGSALLLYLLAYRIRGPLYALIAICLLIPMPMFAFFGRLPSFEPLVAFFLLASLICYQRYLSHGSNRTSYIGMVFFLLLTCLIDWPGYFLTVIILLHFWFVRKKITLPVLILLIVPVCTALLYIYHVVLLTGPEGLHRIFELFLFRSGLSSFAGHPDSLSPSIVASLFDFISLHLYRSILYFSPGIILFSLAFVVSSYRKRDLKDDVIWCLFFTALLNIVVFANASVHHEYWNFYFSYPLALAASHGVQLFWSSGSNLKKCISAVLIVLFITQSMWLLERRHDQNDGYPLDIPLANLLKENLPPGTRAGSSLMLIPHFALYYADVSIMPAVDTKDKLLSLTNNGSYGYFITASAEAIRSHIPYYLNFPSEEIEKLGALPASSDLFQYLKETYPSVERSGFVIFRLN